ncbi:MAG: hypothetical protein J0L57_04665 [Burkholderiales bacterium]|nr:hypothetical protein [Burkholderiales bacterium]
MRAKLSRRAAVSAAAAACLAASPLRAGVATVPGDPLFDPLLDPRAAACAPPRTGSMVPLRLAAAAPQAVAEGRATPQQGAVPRYEGLGTLSLRIDTRHRGAQAYFDQGLRLAFGFNHAEAVRAFREAQRLDPGCAMCFWGEALVLGPNINVPMLPQAQAPALAALDRAVALKAGARPRDKALIEALQQRYSADPKAERAALDAAYADAMAGVAKRFAADDTVLALAAEAMMDTQPWDYWEPGGAAPKGRGDEIVRLLETVLKRSPSHPGAIHLYIHAVEASAAPERALAPARRLAALTPAAGHLVHMPSHVYYRLGMYRESLAANVRAVQVDERYFETSASDPLYRSAYYPHNIHFVMVSAQFGGDGATAVDAAAKLDASIPEQAAREFAVLQPIKAAPYTTLALFAAPDQVLRLPAPPPDLALVRALYHYARALAHARLDEPAKAQLEIDAIGALERGTDFAAFEAWGVPAREVTQIARLVAVARLADAQGRLDEAAGAYADAAVIEDKLSYMEPPFWYYPVRQSLGAVYLRQGKLDAARAVLRESLVKVRHNGWALAALVEVERRSGDKRAEAAALQAYRRAWFGPADGPDLARL